MTLQDANAPVGSTNGFPKAPRWLQIPVGLAFVVPGLLLLAAGIAPPFLYPKHMVVQITVSLFSLAGAALCLRVAWRLVLGRSRADGGLVSPLFLRAAAALFVALPVLALATGSWRSMDMKPGLIALQMFSNFVVAVALIRLARRRRAREGESAAWVGSSPIIGGDRLGAVDLPGSLPSRATDAESQAGRPRVKDHVRFQTQMFNASEVKSNFINPLCFGEDLAEWLGDRLPDSSLSCGSSFQEDWGWRLPVQVGRVKFYINMGLADESAAGVPIWLAWVQSRGFLSRFRTKKSSDTRSIVC